ncbi:hypothetical protein SAMN05421870_11285 [Streptomyces qinglanensis]|uniref:Uncharacterized protein n=1 Tax=Streptomyces qinglanensis TaxID=943816 RepID=A0A1H9VL27_9ACTN|nr:hypothetical protein SAMN05421870_11285 [Streptomyces qinglanensis]
MLPAGPGDRTPLVCALSAPEGAHTCAARAGRQDPSAPHRAVRQGRTRNGRQPRASASAVHRRVRSGRPEAPDSGVRTASTWLTPMRLRSKARAEAAM